MDLDDQIGKFDELIDYIENELPRFANAVLATDLIAIVTNRVVQKALNYKGDSFSPYSTNKIAAFRLVAKSRNNSADRKVRALARAKGALSYSEFRKLNNLKADKKNFEFFGNMWKKFGIINEVKTAKGFSIIMGGTTTDAQNKMDDNSEREGVNIIEASEAEEALTQATASAWLNEQAERILNE